MSAAKEWQSALSPKIILSQPLPDSSRFDDGDGAPARPPSNSLQSHPDTPRTITTLSGNFIVAPCPASAAGSTTGILSFPVSTVALLVKTHESLSPRRRPHRWLRSRPAAALLFMSPLL